MQKGKRRKELQALIVFSSVLIFGFIAAIFLSFRLPLEDETKPIQAPLNEEFLEYKKRPYLDKFRLFSAEGYPLGLLPSPHDVSHFLDRPPVRISGLPASYDLRQQKKLTSVKNQGNCGSCWAFATYGSLESFLLPAENWDFSEQNLIDRHGFDYGPCKGGNIYMSAAYLARWSGPVKEEDDPYVYRVMAQFPVRKHVQEIIFIPPRSDSLDNDLIKQAVLNYGAVYTSMYYASSCYHPGQWTYYNPDRKEGSHAVAIVGWDDNFDRARFLNQPPGNGAFIVKNSWGGTWGDSGYFYVSYYDRYLARRGFNALVKAETITNYEVVYQYDLLGWTTSLGYSGRDYAWYANIFTANSSAPLTAVSFYAPAATNIYEIYIYLNVAPDQPRSGTLATFKSGRLDSPGYFTIPLDNAIAIMPQQRFSVVVKMTTPGYNYPIPVEKPISGYSSQARSSAGESFVSSDGISWADLHTSWSGSYANTSVCLKAFAGYPPLYPPANFKLQRLENNLIFFKEYINQLTWEANPDNKTRILKYRLYRKAKDEPDKNFKLMAEMESNVFHYLDRGLKKNDLYAYWITAVDEYGRESEPAFIKN